MIGTYTVPLFSRARASTQLDGRLGTISSMACAPVEYDDESQSDQSELEDITVIPETPSKAVCESDEDAVDVVKIIDVAGASFMYRIPRFPVVTINLRQITFEAIFSDGSTITYDGFIHEHSTLYGHNYPATIRIYESCFVEVGCEPKY